MPIKPPNLDDRRYADLVKEARALIPQYCPEWTNLSDADPGITLVQLFAWMTELTIYRLNRVPDKTYIHFLNFIGEERKRARPSVAPITFLPRLDRAVELPPFVKASTRQREDNVAYDLVTTDRITVHNSRVLRVMAVRGGRQPAVREVPFSLHEEHPFALSFSNGRGVQLFELDPVEYGPDAYTPHQFLYLSHDDLRLMDINPEEDGRPVGRMRVRRATDGLSVANFFRWEYPTEQGWMPIGTEDDEDGPLGMPEDFLLTALPGIVPIPFDIGKATDQLPEAISSAQWWIRGRLDYERWLAARMEKDLEVGWKDDRGGEERPLNNWQVRARGRTLELSLDDLPPIKGGWTIRLALVDRSVRAGRGGYLPGYRWSYRRGDVWEDIPRERIRTEGTSVILAGPLTDMASDGFNLRAERIETVYFRGFMSDLDLDLTWLRPVEVVLFAGDDPRRAELLPAGEGPYNPFQIAPMIPPTIGRKFYIGTDLFENRKKASVLVEVEIGFEMNGELIEEPTELYALQMTYRAEDSWRVVWSEDQLYTRFTFSQLDEDGAKRAAKRKIRFNLDPKTQLKGIDRHTVGGMETTWVRLELVKASLTGVDEKKVQHPIALKIYGVKLGVDRTLGAETYEQPMPNPRMVQLDLREQNRRLTRVVTRATGRLSEFFPFFPFVDIEEENQALYLHFDKPLPMGARHALQFRCRGEAFLPAGVGVEWEVLEDRGHGRTSWRRIPPFHDGDAERKPYDLARTGVLEFPWTDPPPVPDDGFWLRGRFSLPAETSLERIPPLPPVTHLFTNTVDAAAMFTQRTERYSGHGVPHQTIQLLKKPLYLHPGEGERAIFPRPELFDDIKLFVEGDGGRREEWKRVDSMLTAKKDDPVYMVDPVEGTITFGNGIRGKMMPVGSNNILVDVYRVVPGANANVGPGAVSILEGFGDVLEVTNLMPASGGRDAESIEEIIRRAPTILTTRDRAVTRADFEMIAKEASGEVARAACTGRMDADGQVGVVILPHRREGERIPDPFLATGLRDHVGRYMKKRCLINVDPVVRLARFLPIDVSVSVRLRPYANPLLVRENAEKWIRSFLDPYAGGLDHEGWPFSGTLYSQDVARLVTDVSDVRHVVDVQLYDMRAKVTEAEMARDESRAVPGWEEGEGRDALQLVEHDLFVVRRIRVRTEEGNE